MQANCVKRIDFPSSFLWGASISSYQTEGKNYNSDWYLWEKEKKLQPAYAAARHYELFREDFRLAKELNLKAVRFSIEWARICPKQGSFDEKEIKHYKELIQTLKALNLKPFLTLHHFTNPIWFADSNGWLSTKNIDYFLAYLKLVAEEFKNDIRYWMIFNEPLVYIYNGYICGIWPPGIRSLRLARKALKNIVSAYVDGYAEIKNIYKQNNLDCEVSFAKHIRKFSPCPDFNFGQNSISAFFRDKVFNVDLMDYLSRKLCLDYIAINYYCKEYVKFKGLLGKECNCDFHKERKNILGWYNYPKGLYESLKMLKKYKLPIFIMENGTAEAEDYLYKEYLFSHIEYVAKAISEGINVAGYFWWSLIDNFEWDKGFSARFGLIEVNYETFERKIKPFAYAYAKICKENRIDISEDR